MSDLVERRIEPRDDLPVAALIRTVMPEFGASGRDAWYARAL